MHTDAQKANGAIAETQREVFEITVAADSESYWSHKPDTARMGKLLCLGTLRQMFYIYL